jgi:hypothetical protein
MSQKKKKKGLKSCKFSYILKGVELVDSEKPVSEIMCYKYARLVSRDVEHIFFNTVTLA